MIKAGEIRLGNWLIIEGRIKRIDADFMWAVFERVQEDTIEKELTSSVTWIDPIPITSDLLGECGFECINRVSLYFKKYLNNVDARNIQVSLAEVGNNPEWIVGYFSADFGGGYVRLTKIKHLHELQNIYYFIAGEELEVNPPLS